MIRHFLRSFAYTGASLWAASELSGGGIVFARGPETFVMAVIGVSLANHIVRPMLNLLLLPINLITLGVFRWVTSVLLLYIITLIVPGFSIVSFDFSGLVWQGIVVPAVHVQGFLALVAVSFVISFVSSLLFWLAK